MINDKKKIDHHNEHYLVQFIKQFYVSFLTGSL